MFNTPDLGFDISDAIFQWAQGFQRFGIEAIKTVTGLNLTSPQTLVESIIELLAEGIGALEPLAALIGVSVDALGDFFHNLLGKNSPLNAGNIVGEIVDDVVPGIKATIDAFWAALTGQHNTTGTRDETAAQLAELAATVSANAAAIADLQAIDDGNTNSGITGIDDFERTNATGVGPGWNENYSSGDGHYLLDGHQAVWQDGGSLLNDARFRRTDPADAITKTDFQKVTLVIGTQVGEGPQLFASSGDRLYGRMNAAETQYIFGEMYTDGSNPLALQARVRFVYRNGGEQVEIANQPCAGRGIGVTYNLLCGTSSVGGLYTYQIVRNGAPILTFEDTNHLIAVGPDNRGWGWGGRAGNKAAGQATPSAITRVTIADNTPVAVTGTTFRVSRSLTTGVTKPAGDNLLPANTFNTIDYLTADLLWSPTINSITVAKSGTYLFFSRVQVSDGIGAGEQYSILLYVNGVLQSRAGGYGGLTLGTFGTGIVDNNKVVGGGGFLTYLNVGDTVSFGMGSNGAKSVVGAAGGVGTWITGTRIG